MASESENLGSRFEPLLLEEELPCQHRHHGCNFEGILDDLDKHNEICRFRPLKCYLDRFDECTGSSLHLSEYIDHLKSIHHARSIKEVQSGTSIFRARQFLGGVLEDQISDLVWDENLIVYDGMNFVVEVFNRDDLIYFAIILIGEKEEATKYDVRLRVPETPNGEESKFEQTTSVISIRELQENKRIQDLPLAVVHKGALEKLGVLSPQADNKMKFSWSLRITKL